MFESIKTKLWDQLKEKEVSLAMLYNREGEILWHKGRDIVGKNIEEGEGFSKTYLKKAIEESGNIEEKNVLIQPSSIDLPGSARILNIKSLLVQPVSNNYFLYIDSGIKDSFSDSDIEVFKAMGWLLGEVIADIKKSGSGSGGISGTSKQINKIRDHVLKYAIEEEPVLLLGETGSGKSHIAELIHRYSGRKGNFFTINTPGIPANLFESEIFGHKKGAFTDASTDRRGYIDAAKGGTLFFDEIAEVPISFQAKLLRFIETKKYIVLGESVEKEADVRIVAATNIDLHKAIADKEFREDLYFRLQVLEIEIPPLRERKEDIEALVRENMNLLRGKKIGEKFWEAVKGYSWPGNVRELLSVLTRAGILLDGPVTGKDIRDIIKQSKIKVAIDTENKKIDQIWADIKSGKSFWDVVKGPFLQRLLNCSEVKMIIDRGLDEVNGKYSDLINVLNLEEKEYKKFMNFLMVHKIMENSTGG